MWDALAEICGNQEVSTNDFCSLVDETRGESSLTAAIRVAIVEYYRELARSGQPLQEPTCVPDLQATSVAAPASRAERVDDA